MTPNLTKRLQEIPGVAAVAVDLTEAGGGINIRLDSGADEAAVLERVRELLAAYGARLPDERPRVKVGRSKHGSQDEDRAEETSLIAQLPDVEVIITHTTSGARIEVSTATVRSFRNVAADPKAIAQGLSDAWCQVAGRIPVEIIAVSRDERGWLRVEATDGTKRTKGAASLSQGWRNGLIMAVGLAIGAVDSRSANNPVAVGSSS